MRIAAAAVILALVSLLPAGAGAGDPPPATDVLPVVARVEVVSRLGEESVILLGRMQVQRSQAAGGSQLDVPAVRLRGASRLGVINVTERAAAPSTGELVPAGPGGAFPARMTLDVFFHIDAPASPIGPLTFQNEEALRLLPAGDGLIDAWPPLGVTLRLAPVFGFDNDGDGLIDEDGRDEDGDVLVDEDRPGPDPPAPGADACGDDADCDGLDGEDPPAALCGPALCDEDGDGLVDEDPSCVPLFHPDGHHLKLGLCVRDVTMDVAPELIAYSAGRAGRGLIHPADVLGLLPADPLSSGQQPFVRIPCAALGLSAEGCDAEADGNQDNIDALSFGADFAGPATAAFSVAPGSTGLPGTGVRAQTMCPPGAPGTSPEPEPDVFQSELRRDNAQTFDGNGPVGTCPGAFPLGLVESPGQLDDLDALVLADPSAVNPDGNGVPERPVYFSLDAASPSLAAIGASPADVLVTFAGAAPSVYASGEVLGLRAGDDIDGLCIGEAGDGTFGVGDIVAFSLAAGSPTLAHIGASPADVLVGGPAVVESAGRLGLAAADDIDALACGSLRLVGPNGDIDCSGETDAVDAALILSYHAGLIDTLPCAGDGDVNLDGSLTSIDATLVLQLASGLLDALPVRL